MLDRGNKPGPIFLPGADDMPLKQQPRAPPYTLKQETSALPSHIIRVVSIILTIYVVAGFSILAFGAYTTSLLSSMEVAHMNTASTSASTHVQLRFGAWNLLYRGAISKPAVWRTSYGRSGPGISALMQSTGKNTTMLVADACFDNSPKLLVSIFSAAASRERRKTIRKHQRFGEKCNTRELKCRFVIEEPHAADMHSELVHEMNTYHDIILLKKRAKTQVEKAFNFFEYLSHHPEYQTHFLVKQQDDTLVDVPPLWKDLQGLACENLVYYGSCNDFTCGQKEGQPFRFSSKLYGLSWPLVDWLGSADRPHNVNEGNAVSMLIDALPLKEKKNLILQTMSEQTVHMHKLNLDGAKKPLAICGLTDDKDFEAAAAHLEKK